MSLKVKCQSFKEKNNVSPNTTNFVFIKPIWVFLGHVHGFVLLFWIVAFPLDMHVACSFSSELNNPFLLRFSLFVSECRILLQSWCLLYYWQIANSRIQLVFLNKTFFLVSVTPDQTPFFVNEVFFKFQTYNPTPDCLNELTERIERSVGEASQAIIQLLPEFPQCRDITDAELIKTKSMLSHDRTSPFNQVCPIVQAFVLAADK